MKPVVKGLLTWIPGVYRAVYAHRAGVASAAYAYGVWLKHLTLAWHHGMDAMPRTLVELGPGVSLGTGVAALLSGVTTYVARDAVRSARPEADAKVLEDMVALFQSRAPRPSRGIPDYDAHLDERLFPGHILTEERLARSLAPARIDGIRTAVSALDSASPGGIIRYGTWSDPDPLRPGAADLVMSHSVLQHATDLGRVYRQCHLWLRPGGWMSHQIDLTSHGITHDWNGHLHYGDRLWAVIAGRRPYFINRATCSTHLRLLDEHGFEVVTQYARQRPGGLDRGRLASRWRGMDEADLHCAGLFVLARKRA